MSLFDEYCSYIESPFLVCHHLALRFYTFSKSLKIIVVRGEFLAFEYAFIESEMKNTNFKKVSFGTK